MLLEHSVNNGATLADGSNTNCTSFSRVFGNATGVSPTNDASLLSYKNNDIELNGNNGAPTDFVSGD